MPPNTSNTLTQNNGIIAERLEALRCDMAELKVSNAELTKAVNTLAKTYEVEHVRVVSDINNISKRLDAIDRPRDGRLDQIEAKLEQIAKDLQPLVTANRIMVWIAGALGVSVIGLIWAILTHQILLVVP